MSKKTNPETMQIPDYEKHPLADLFPLMQDDEYEALKADIRKHGLREPITLCEGKILDGRNRFEICREVQVEPRFVEFEGESPLDYVLSKNMFRRNLSSSQRACIAVEIEARLSETAKQRQKEGGRKGGLKRAGANADSDDKLPQNSADPFTVWVGEARVQAARIAATNADYVTKAKALRNRKPELFREVFEGRTSVVPAYHLMRDELEDHSDQVSDTPEETECPLETNDATTASAPTNAVEQDQLSDDSRRGEDVTTSEVVETTASQVQEPAGSTHSQPLHTFAFARPHIVDDPSGILDDNDLTVPLDGNSEVNDWSQPLSVTPVGTRLMLGLTNLVGDFNRQLADILAQFKDDTEVPDHLVAEFNEVASTARHNIDRIVDRLADTRESNSVA